MLTLEYGNRSLVAQRMGINTKTFADYYRGKAHMDYKTLICLEELLNIKFEIKKFKSERQSLPVSLPKELSREFAELMGLLLSNSQIKGNRNIILLHNTPNTRDRFAFLTKILFGLKPTEIYNKNAIVSSLNSKLVVEYLIWQGIPKIKRAQTCRIPNFIVSGKIDFLKSFLAGFIAGDGHIGDDCVEIVTSNSEINSDLSEILTRLGIVNLMESNNDKARDGFVNRIEWNQISKLNVILSSEFKYLKIQRINKLADNLHI